MIHKIQLVYFSPAQSTRNILRRLASNFNLPIEEINVTIHPATPISIEPNTLLIVGIPVYAGRIPALAKERLTTIKGNNSPAIAICVYGNRHYDDALLELSDMLQENSFELIAAAALIARHSIFPTVAKNRPDAKDNKELEDFASNIFVKLNSNQGYGALIIPGNRPYREPQSIPLNITTSKACDNCGTCVEQCPAQAIHKDQPKITDNEKCIRCTRCIVVCPQKAKKFGGLKYKILNKLFTNKHNKTQKENTFIL